MSVATEVVPRMLYKIQVYLDGECSRLNECMIGRFIDSIAKHAEITLQSTSSIMIVNSTWISV